MCFEEKDEKKKTSTLVWQFVSKFDEKNLTRNESLVLKKIDVDKKWHMCKSYFVEFVDKNVSDESNMNLKIGKGVHILT